MKLSKVKNCWEKYVQLCIKKTQNFSTYETSENLHPFVFISLFIVYNFTYSISLM